jgi:3-deoxy-manno-octulosonate cytidylyltransferase (CMP-KDO synthetase)
VPKIVAFIPARFPSTRFPGKPLAPISGKPMIQHVYERAQACPDLDETYVATDDQRIYACVEGFGGRAIMTAEDHRSGTDRIAEAAERLNVGPRAIVVNIQGDQPLNKDRTIPMSTLMYEIKEDKEIQDPNNVKVVVDTNGYALYFSRLPIPFVRDKGSAPHYYKHIGIYAYRNEFLLIFTKLPYGRLEEIEKLEQLRALEHGFKIKVIETPFDSTEVDVPEDIIEVERQLAQSKSPGP